MPEPTPRHCERCRVEITRDNADAHRTFTRFIETTRRHRYGMSAIVYRDDGVETMISRFEFCRDCGDAWSDFLQGRPTEGVHHA